MSLNFEISFLRLFFIISRLLAMKSDEKHFSMILSIIMLDETYVRTPVFAQGFGLNLYGKNCINAAHHRPSKKRKNTENKSNTKKK